MADKNRPLHILKYPWVIRMKNIRTLSQIYSHILKAAEYILTEKLLRQTLMTFKTAALTLYA